MYTDIINLLGPLLPFITSLWAVGYALYRFVRILKPLQQTTVNTDRDHYWEVVKIVKQMRSNRREPFPKKLIKSLKKEYAKFPSSIRQVFRNIPFGVAIILLVSQLMSNAHPNNGTIFQIVINCQAIVLYLLVFFLSPALKKINSDIKYVADAPKREAWKRESERRRSA